MVRFFALSPSKHTTRVQLRRRSRFSVMLYERGHPTRRGGSRRTSPSCPPYCAITAFELFSDKLTSVGLTFTRRQTCLVVAIRRSGTKQSSPHRRACRQYARAGCRVEPPDHSISQNTTCSTATRTYNSEGRAILLSLVLFPICRSLTNGSLYEPNHAATQ